MATNYSDFYKQYIEEKQSSTIDDQADSKGWTSSTHEAWREWHILVSFNVSFVLFTQFTLLELCAIIDYE